MKYFLLKKAIAELIGTFTMVFAGCAAIMAHGLYPDSVSAGSIPLVFGLVVAAMIYTIGHISGAHMNPAVTLAFAVVRRFSWKELPIYWLAQFMGGICAVGILFFSLPESNNYGATIPNISATNAFLWEFLLTFFLMFVITGVATDSRAVGVMAGVAIGATVALDAFIGGTFTGASMNPARSLAPALFSGNLESLWIYMTAPFMGAISGAFIYDFLRCEPGNKKEHVKGCC